MDRNGIQYRLLCNAYPRYRYFYEGQKSIMARWSSLLHLSNIQKIIRCGEQRFAEIMHSSDQLFNTVSLYVFGDKHLPKPTELCVEKDPTFVVDQKSVTLKDLVKTRCPLNNLLKGFKRHMPRLGVELTTARLNTAKGSETKDMMILVLVTEDLYSIQIVHSTYTLNHINEIFAGDIHDKSELKHISVVPDAIQLELEKLVLNMVCTSGNYLDELLPSEMVDSRVEDSSIHVINDLKNAFYNEWALKDILKCAKKDRSVDVRLVFVRRCANVIRGVMCAWYSENNGIMACLINTVLCDKSFDIDLKVEQCFRKNAEYDTSEFKNIVDLKDFFDGSSDAIMKALGDAKRRIASYLDVVEELQKVQFEFFGLRRQSVIKPELYVPVSNLLPAKLQTDIMNIDNVIACGNVYGTMKIFVNDDITLEEKRELQKVIWRNNYGYKYSVEVGPSFKRHAGYDIVTGRKITAIHHKKTRKNCGTLCCFAFIQRNAGPVNDRRLYALSCAHCFEDCQNSISVPIGQENITLGTVEYDMKRDLGLDLAAIQVEPDAFRHCNFSLYKSDGITSCDNWNWSGVDANTSVYKVGAVTGLTSGLVVGDNIATKVYNEYNNLHKDGPKFDFVNNILVEYRSNKSDKMSAQLFSQHGDSGSAICKENPDGSVSVVGILYGKFTYGDRCFTYAGKMQRTMNDFEAREAVKVTPANRLDGV